MLQEEEPEIEAAEEDIWAGVDYTVDTETGEWVAVDFLWAIRKIEPV